MAFSLIRENNSKNLVIKMIEDFPDIHKKMVLFINKGHHFSISKSLFHGHS